MMRSRFRAALFCCALLLPAFAAVGVERGQPLTAALAELRRAGLRVIFSSALVAPGLRVTVEPGRGSPEELARRILAPHGLALDPVRAGLFAVVRNPGPLAAPSAMPSTVAPAAPDGVEIWASRYAVEQQTSAAFPRIRREELERLPGLNQDALRVTRFLPGTAPSPFGARAHVRGGRQDELAVYFDGVPLYEPFHFKDVHGLLGILDPGAVSSIDFFSGVFPARFGNRLSGVLDMRPRRFTGRNEHALGLSFLYSHAFTQGRLEKRPVQWLGVFRRSNLRAFAELAEWDGARPDFLDGLVRVEMEAGERSSVTLGWLVLDDDLTADLKDRTEQAVIGHRDATSWIAWRFLPDDTSEVQATVSRTERHTNRDGRLNRPGAAAGTLHDHRLFDTTTLRLEGSARLTRALQLGTGVEVYDYRSTYDLVSQGQLEPELAGALGRPATYAHELHVRPGGQAYAAYAALLLTPSGSMSVDAGLRWDAQRYGTAFRADQLSPRLALQYRADPVTTMRLSWGRLAQAQRPDELQVADGDPAFHAVQRASEGVLSVERRLPGDALLRIEAFGKRIRSPRPAYENLLDPLVLLPELEVDRVAVRPESSRAYGAELSLRWQAGARWSGWSSYAWSEVTDRFSGDDAPRSWDQRHALSTSVVWMRAPWELAANAAWHSGWPRSMLGFDATGHLAATERNGGSWPDYFSLDLRASWSRDIARGALQLYGELGNASGHDNLCCATYRLVQPGSISSLERDTSVWLPRYVLVGVIWHLP
ncbi:MAG: TonB-dependent receptor [Gammaproteobacteria bacterium]|nr:TonB-dependent receptor [Gammaproteobacteria bacterium]